jgi:hypothetical protein
MGEFIIRTDQISLIYLLEQKVHTLMQYKGMSKLLRLNYKIEYKEAENKMADVLSRMKGHNGELLCYESAIKQLVKFFLIGLMIKDNYLNDSWLQELQTKMEAATTDNTQPKLTKHVRIFRYNGRIYVGSDSNWREQILRELHDSNMGGHSDFTTTY